MAQRHGFNIFTNGSKTPDGAGAAIFFNELNLRQPYKLPNHCTIFQAEVFAVWKAVELAETRTTVNSVVNLYIDSQAAIKGITAYKVNSKLVNSCKAAVERLATNRKLHIYWVPSHVGIPGNEAADEVARSGVHLPEEQMMDVPAPLRAVNSKLEMYMVAKAKDRWNNIATCKVARTLCKSYNATLTKFILSLRRKECRTLVGILTGHCLVAAHAHRLGIIDDDTCTKCMEQGVRGS